MNNCTPIFSTLIKHTVVREGGPDLVFGPVASYNGSVLLVCHSKLEIGNRKFLLGYTEFG